MSQKKEQKQSVISPGEIEERRNNIINENANPIILALLIGQEAMLS